MNVATIELRRYVTAQGISPFGVWLRELGDARSRAWIEVRLKRIGAGLLGDWRAVGHGVIEFRLDIGPGYRVYAGRHGARLPIGSTYLDPHGRAGWASCRGIGRFGRAGW